MLGVVAELALRCFELFDIQYLKQLLSMKCPACSQLDTDYLVGQQQGGKRQKAISKWQMANGKRVNKLKSGQCDWQLATGNKLHFDCMASLVHDLDFWLLLPSSSTKVPPMHSAVVPGD